MIFEGLYFAAALIDAVLHIIGILVLRNDEDEPTNPKIIISNLSLTEFLYCFAEVLHYSIILAKAENEIVIIIFSFIRYAIFLAIKMVTIYMITDRYIAIDWEADYYVYFHKDRVFTLLSAMWALGAFFGLIFGVLVAENKGETVAEVENFISLALDITIILFGLRTIIFYYENKSKVQELREKRSEAGNDQYSNFTFYIPCLMVLAYIVWNGLATMIFQKKYLGNKNASDNDDVIHVGKMMIMIGFGLQAILYTYMQEEGKSKVLALFGVKKKDKPIVDEAVEPPTRTNPTFEDDPDDEPYGKIKT